MKLKIDWKKTARLLRETAAPVLLGALAGGAMCAATGCSSLTPSNKTQSMSVVGIGLPAVAIVHSSTLAADAAGADTNAPTQSNPVTTEVTTR